MPRASVTFTMLLLTSFLLNLAGYSSPVLSITEFFSDTGSTCTGSSPSLRGCLSHIATIAVPIIIVGALLLSGNQAFLIAGAYLVLPLVTIPYELFSAVGVPAMVKYLMGGWYMILIGFSGLSIMKGDV